MKLLLLGLGMMVFLASCATGDYVDPQEQKAQAEQKAQEKALAKKLATVKVTKIEPQNCRLVDYYFVTERPEYSNGYNPARELYPRIQRRALAAKGNVAVIDGVVTDGGHAAFNLDVGMIGRIFNCPAKK